MKTIEELEAMLDGERNPMREYVICHGQSNQSKDVMFVFYSILRECLSPYVNPMNYLGILGGDLETACINARKRCPKFKIEIWDTEVKRRKNPLVIAFGKYRGLTCEQIFDKDPDYLFWLANNGKFNSRSMRETMEQYREICKEIIIGKNRERSNEPLPVEEKATNKHMVVKKIDEYPYGSGYNISRRVKLIDSDGNRYLYTGSSVVFAGATETVDFKCKVVGHKEILGVLYNVIKVR